MTLRVLVSLGLATASLSACTVQKTDEADNPSAAATLSTEVPATEVPAVAVAASPAAGAPTAAPLIIPVSAQGVAEVGLTVRVKSVELGADATVLDISASYGGTASSDVDLAFSPTFIKDEQGNKLMLKRIAGNEDLKIKAGEQMDGRLVFLGAVPPNAKSITLVLNEGNDGSAITGPGLNIPIPLQQDAP